MQVGKIQRNEHTGRNYRARTGTRVLIMTATLTPPPMAVARHDPATRLRDYAQALSHNLALPAERFDRIVFADNSDSDLTPLLELTRRENSDKRVELLSFQANDHDPALGKAFGEFRILDTALEASVCIAPDDHVWKTTGRLRCLNILELDAASAEDDSIVCDLFGLPFIRSGRWDDRGRMELRLFRFKPVAYDRWFRSSQRNGPETFDEALLFRVMVQARKQAKLRVRFPVQPMIAGVSGRTQLDYMSSEQGIKDHIRSASRRLTPWIWL